MKQLPIPKQFIENNVGKVWRVEYQKCADRASKWAKEHNISNASDDQVKVALLLIDCQNTFCTPKFEMFLGGKSGNAAVIDNQRMCKFIYRNLRVITKVYASLDTHKTMQIFHPIFLINDKGEHPRPFTPVSLEDIESGKWKVNPAVPINLHKHDKSDLQKHLTHYCRELSRGGKYLLMIWPYHAMLGGIGHALVSSIEETLFFHNVARQSQSEFLIKGDHPLTENYSILAPEITGDTQGKKIGKDNTALIEKLLKYDAVIIAGQAKSHCVAWTIEDMLKEINKRNHMLANKFYLLEDCTSPVATPQADFTIQANEAFKRFADAGINVVKSTDPINKWPKFPR